MIVESFFATISSGYSSAFLLVGREKTELTRSGLKVAANVEVFWKSS